MTLNIFQLLRHIGNNVIGFNKIPWHFVSGLELLAYNNTDVSLPKDSSTDDDVISRKWQSTNSASNLNPQFIQIFIHISQTSSSCLILQLLSLAIDGISKSKFKRHMIPLVPGDAMWHHGNWVNIVLVYFILLLHWVLSWTNADIWIWPGASHLMAILQQILKISIPKKGFIARSQGQQPPAIPSSTPQLASSPLWPQWALSWLAAGRLILF